MFHPLFIIFFAAITIATSAAPVNFPTVEESKTELKDAGMTQASIDQLSAFTQRFATGYPVVQSNKEASDKFIADYSADVQNFVKSMNEKDQTLYHNYLVKYGLA